MLKFIHVFPIFFCAVNCFSIPENVQIRIPEAVCQAEYYAQTNLDPCRSPLPNCSGSKKIDWSFNDNLTQESPPRLLCRSDDLLSFRWNLRGNDSSYIVEFRAEGEDKWTFLETTNCAISTLGKLHQSFSYQIRIWRISSFGVVDGPINSKWMRTFSGTNVPMQITDFHLKNLTTKENLIDAFLEWTPAEDMSCYYDFVVFDGRDDFKQIEVKEPKDLFQIKLRHLAFETNYSVAIMAKSSDWRRESPKTWTYFMTPKCVEVLKNLKDCPALPVEHLKVDEELCPHNSKGILRFSSKISWVSPKLLPDFYTVSLLVFSPNISKYSVNVSGDATGVTFQCKELGLHYQVLATAHSFGGPSKLSTIYRHVSMTNSVRVPQTGLSTTALILISLGVLVLLVLGIAGGIFVCHQCAKRERTEERCQYFQELEDKAPQYTDTLVVETVQDDIIDKWEVSADQISLGTTLGQGAFGIVRKGWLKMDDGTYKEVAVKMLQENSSIEEKRQFLQEIEIMKSVGPHKHLVSLVACCVKKSNLTPLLIVEYCSRGDLKTYLQTAWETITNQNLEIHYADLVDSEDVDVDTKHCINKTYYLQNENVLQPRDLLSFARQIAVGMEYLSSLHVLHRDLAARNVLVCENKTVKVSDFGLSRDVYKDNIYYKAGNGKLPVRWMALESLTHQVYTIQSDVWSFGILLWEIVTLGGNPYPGISSQDLPRLLENGYRMEIPANCSNDLYNLMMNCWKKSSKDRPTFTEIRNYLDKLLENVGDYLNLGVSVCREMNSFRGLKYVKNKKTTSSERYVKPITVHR